MKKLAIAVFAMSCCAQLALAAVDFDNGNFDLKNEISDLALKVPAPAVKPAGAQKDWTIMVFVNGKNNLEQFALKDMNEMEQVGSSDKVNIVTEVGRMNGYDTSDGDWKTVRRYLVKKDADPSHIASPVVQELQSVDMGDYHSVIDFADWAKANYPAKHYMLIIWNHGAGWIKGLPPATKGISYDEVTNHHIDTPQLGQVLKQIGGVDVYGSDACLMQMAEVDYELKDYAQYIVGSEETEPGDGYTYNTFLGPLVANPAMTPEQVARQAVDAYADHYQTTGDGSTQSFLKTSDLPGFLNATDAFASAIMKAGDKAAATTAMNSAQKYAYPENKDLYDFARLVVANTKNADVKAKGQALMDYIKNTLIRENRTTDSSGGWYGPTSYANSNGIAVYLPGKAAPSTYAALQWAKASNWDDFIAYMAK